MRIDAIRLRDSSQAAPLIIGDGLVQARDPINNVP
jgi:hypothetical protein